MSIHNNCGLCKASVVNLSVYDGDEAIIHDVNMEFHCGEITALIGKNGSGNSYKSSSRRKTSHRQYNLPGS